MKKKEKMNYFDEFIKNAELAVEIVKTLRDIIDKFDVDKMQEDMFNKAYRNLNEKTYDADTLEEVKDIMENHPGFVNAYWCGDEDCELKMKEIRGTKSRCIVESEDYETEKCIVCGKKAKHKVVWGIQY